MDSDVVEESAVLESLHEVTRELLAAESRDEIARRTAEAARDILGHESNVVRLRTGADTLEPAAVTAEAKNDMGARPEYDIEGGGLPAKAFRQAEPLLIDDVTQVEAELDLGDVRAAMYLPLGEFGVLSIVSTSVSEFDRSDVDLASILASNSEAALDRLERERELERQNQRLAVFVDVTSHDIPNHLTAASTWCDVVQESGDTAELERVETALDRIGEVIADMHTLVTTGEQVGETEWILFSDLVEACWGTCCQDGRNLEVKQDGHVRADRSRLKQLLENLFWNACEYGGDDPTVTVGVTDDGFYVADDGAGIPPAEREAVLEPGYTTAVDHAGFGLAIVREIARGHGWELAIRDSESGGARFEFSGVRVQERTE